MIVFIEKENLKCSQEVKYILLVQINILKNIVVICHNDLFHIRSKMRENYGEHFKVIINIYLLRNMYM